MLTTEIKHYVKLIQFIGNYHSKYKARMVIASLGILISGIIWYIILSNVKPDAFSIFLDKYQLYQPALAFEKTEDVYLGNFYNEMPFDKTLFDITLPGNVIFHGQQDRKQIALTFDAEMTDGMRVNYLSGRVKSSYDKRIIDILNQTQTEATLFLTGMWIELYPEITKELVNNPLFELGSHSYTDSSFSGYCYGLKQLTDSQAVEQVKKTEFLLKMYTGTENRLFRFPGGCYSQKSLDMLTQQTQDTVIQWDVSGDDGFNKNTEQIIKNVVNRVQNGSIIILHLNGTPTAPKTADALPEIIKQLKSKGFEFLKVSELLGFQ